MDKQEEFEREAYGDEKEWERTKDWKGSYVNIHKSKFKD